MPNHLIHIGYPKAGSTYLQRWFAVNPQLCYAEGGILGFDSVFQIARQAVQPCGDWLYRVTSCEDLSSPPLATSVMGDHIQAGNLEQIGELKSQERKRVCASLAELFPDATILLVTRGFRSFLLSGYSQYLREGGHADFETSMRALKNTPMATDICCNYDELIGWYSEAFAGRIIVLPYELLRDKPLAYIQALEAALGLQHCPPLQERVNPSLSPVELSWYPRMAQGIQRLPIGWRLREALNKRFIRALNAGKLTGLVTRLQKTHPLPPVTADRISDEIVNKFKGCAGSLRENPMFAPYAADYLF